MNETDLCFTPATELVDAVRARKLSAVEITTAVLKRAEALREVVDEDGSRWAGLRGRFVVRGRELAAAVLLEAEAARVAGFLESPRNANIAQAR